jgi:hypothetical protein
MTAELSQEYAGLGVRFRFPDDWELSEDLRDDEASITVSSPESAFWSVTILRHRPDPAAALRAATRAYQEEYEEVDVSESEDVLADRKVRGVDVEFVCLELTSAARLRAFRTGRMTVLVVWQLADLETELYGELLQQICDSLTCLSEDDPYG